MSTTTNSAILVSGITGSGKTSLLATLAEWVKKTTGKKSRLYTADGGGYGDKMEALIELGVVEVFRLRTRVGAGGEGLVEETCARSSFGWWPESFKNKLAGEVEPRCRMLPPVETVFTMSCPECESALMQASTQKGLTPQKCKKCNKIVTLASSKVTQVSQPAVHMEGVGACFFEGLSSWSNWQLMSLADRRGRNELHGEKSNIGSFKSGELDFDGNNRADYGFAQTAAERWVLNTTSITGLVVPPVWTALETKLEESGERAATWGPQIAGSARTGQVPQWVGDYLGAQQITVEGKDQFRLYLVRYVSPDGVPHPYKTRATPGFYPEFLADAEGAAPFSGFNLGKYMELREEAKKRSMEAAIREFGGKVIEPLAPSKPDEVAKAILAEAAKQVAVPAEVIAAPVAPTPTAVQAKTAAAPKAAAATAPVRRVPPPPPRRR